MAVTKKTTAPTEAQSEAAAIKAEKSTMKAIAESGVVNVMFALDPSLPRDNQFLEYCINGNLFRYPRGQIVQVPKAIFETIERKERYKQMSMSVYDKFTGEGVQLSM